MLAISLFARPMLLHRLSLPAAIVLAGLLGACASDVNPVKAAFVGAGYGPRAVETPDFVAQSRKPGEFMPVGQSAPARPIRARSPRDQESLQSELEGARSRNEARGQAAQDASRAARAGL